MYTRRHRLAALSAASALAAAVLAPVASGTPANSPAHSRQERQLDRACLETGRSVQSAVKAAANGKVQTIQSHLTVVTPGALTGKIAFNLSGHQISISRDGSPAATAGSFGCGESTARPAGAGAGGSHVVATLHRKFTKPGRYTLSFKLNRTGQQMLAQLTSLDRAYYKQHPRGKQPPTLAFGVALSYAPAA